MSGPLEGIRILDFTWALSGPFATMQLRDLGAEVWKIELVGNNEGSRGPGPVVKGINTYFFSVNRGKKSVMIDLKSPRGRELVLGLADRADVVTENFTPGTMRELGLDYQALSARNPALVYASLSGFGQTGPYTDRRAYDVIAQGLSGILSMTGHPDGPPARVGYSIGDLAAGLYAALGIAAALVERNRSGKGQYIDVAMLDAQVNLLENAVIRYFATGESPTRLGTRHPLITPFQAFPTQDGYVVIAQAEDWPAFCRALGREELAADERFVDNRRRTANHAALELVLNEVFAASTKADWIARLNQVCLIAPLNSVGEMVEDPQVRAREMIVDLPAWNGEIFRVSSSPLKLSRTPAQVTEGADRPGGHTEAVLRDELGLSEEVIAHLLAERVIGNGPGERKSR